jgi:hypothetical protein
VRIFFKIIIVALFAGIVYLCYSAIMRPVQFNRAKEARDIVVEKQLGYIRTAQIQYSRAHKGAYCNSWTELIKFVKTAKIAVPQMTKGKPDTTWVSLIDSMYPKGFKADSLKYVPFSKNITFELNTRTIDLPSGKKMYLLQVQTPYRIYLQGMDNRPINDIEMIQTRRGRYAGLRIGDLEHPNNNAGNWEYN